MMNQSDHPDRRLEDEICSLRAQLIQAQEKNNQLFAGDEMSQALSNMPDGTLFRSIRDMKTGILKIHSVSGTWVKITGISVEDAIDNIWNIFSNIDKNDLKLLMQTIEESLEPLTSFKVEVRYHHPQKKNEEYWIQISSYPRREGDFIYANGFIFDITARKIAENDLIAEKENLYSLNSELHAASEELAATNEELAATNEELERYRSHLETMVKSKTKALSSALAENKYQLVKLGLVVEASKIGTWDMEVVKGDPVNPDNKFIWSEEFRQMLGFSNEEDFPNVLSSWSDKLHPDDRDRTLNAFKGHLLDLTGQTPYDLEYRLLRKNGEYGDFHAFGATVRDSEGCALRVAGALKDITEEKRIAEEIRLSHQTMRKVLDGINAKIIVDDFDSSAILFVNEKIKKEFGDIEGKVCWQTLHKGMTGMCPFCPRVHILDDNQQPTGIYRWEFFNDYDHKWYECSDVAIKWIDGRLVHLQLRIDINDRKHAETELIRSKEKAEESDKLKSAFLANMSHEIRTPINGITGFLFFLNDENLPPKRRQECISVINNSSAQLVKLIDDIIDVAKIEAKQMNINPVPVHINSLMTELRLFFETYMQNKNKVHLSLILDDSEFIDNCIAYVDSTRLRQVLSNLMNNAIKYTDKGYVRFGYRQSSPDKLEFFVEDTGIGLKSEHCELVFERFRQADLTSRQQEGNGLGLHISRSLVQMMGGELRVNSTEEKGSTFYFTVSYLPITPEDEHIFMFQQEKVSLENRVALIIESEITKFKYIEKMLTSSGFVVHQAVSITQGLDFISETPDIHAVMVNESMFNRTDNDETKQFKSISPTLPLILIGNKQNEHDVPSKAILEEPINYKELLSVLS